MSWNQETYYRALSARDHRFDGIFFVGVTSTRIYCRPVCPARTPLLKNCTFHRSPAAAAQAGFRPCLRCRPELAPGRAPIDAVSRLARVAAEQLETSESVTELALQLGVSSRQLRRAFQKEFGVSPAALRTHRRLELARRLLRETEMSITDIAYSSGFGSLRRFHAAYKSQFKEPPRARQTGEEQSELRLELAYRDPLNWQSLLDYLAPRLWPGVERVSGHHYRRNVELDGRRGTIEVGPRSDGALEARISVSLSPVVAPVLQRLRRLFDLDCDPQLIAEQLKPQLGDFESGHRVPGAFDNFELSLRAILGQQISVGAATTLGGRLVQRFGQPLESEDAGLTHYFPEPQTLAEACADEIAALGMPRSRALTVQALARAVAAGNLSLQPGVDLQQQLQQLQELPGVGSWTAQYIAMRALRWPDAFPASDLGLRKAMKRISSSELQEKSKAWRPWRAYAAMHLWSTL